VRYTPVDAGSIAPLLTVIVLPNAALLSEDVQASAGGSRGGGLKGNQYYNQYMKPAAEARWAMLKNDIHVVKDSQIREGLARLDSKFSWTHQLWSKTSGTLYIMSQFVCGCLCCMMYLLWSDNAVKAGVDAAERHEYWVKAAISCALFTAWFVRNCFAFTAMMNNTFSYIPHSCTEVLQLFFAGLEPGSFMVSYNWADLEDHNTTMPRKVASVLPNVWLDINELIPGRGVTESCRAAAQNAKFRFVFLSEKYCWSKNCKTELEAICGDAAMELHGRQTSGGIHGGQAGGRVGTPTSPTASEGGSANAGGAGGDGAGAGAGGVADSPPTYSEHHATSGAGAASPPHPSRPNQLATVDAMSTTRRDSWHLPVALRKDVMVFVYPEHEHPHGGGHHQPPSAGKEGAADASSWLELRRASVPEKAARRLLPQNQCSADFRKLKSQFAAELRNVTEQNHIMTALPPPHLARAELAGLLLRMMIQHGTIRSLLEGASPVVRGDWAATAAALSHPRASRARVQRWRPALPFLLYTALLGGAFCFAFQTERFSGSAVTHYGISGLFYVLQGATLVGFLLMFSTVQHDPMYLQYKGHGGTYNADKHKSPGMNDIALLLIVLRSVGVTREIKVFFDPLNPFNTAAWKELIAHTVVLEVDNEEDADLCFHLANDYKFTPRKAEGGGKAHKWEAQDKQVFWNTHGFGFMNGQEMSNLGDTIVSEGLVGEDCALCYVLKVALKCPFDQMTLGEGRFKVRAPSVQCNRLVEIHVVVIRTSNDRGHIQQSTARTERAALLW
jgi:hypothetical protein